MEVKIYTPNGLYNIFENINNIVVDTTDGQRGILPNHMPVVMMLKIGKLDLYKEEKDTFTITKGMLYFEENIATILVDAIENINDIDVARAQRAKERAEQRLARKEEKLDAVRAQAALYRAINRLSAVGK